MKFSENIKSTNKVFLNKNLGNPQRYTAFTLAEVLITLGIIGLVAAITIPTVLNNAQDQQFITGWKKAFSVLNQATISVVSDNAGTIKGLCSDGDNDCLKTAFLSYLRVTKNCDSTTTIGNCWHKANTLKDLNNSFENWSGSGLILNDGMYVLFGHYTQNCTENYGTIYRCGNINVDINGAKGPNVLGKDVFGVHLLENIDKPYGTAGDGLEDTCIASSFGYGCSAKYLYQ